MARYSSAPAIGIDLGTTYCCVGVLHKGKVEIIPNHEDSGNFTTPSYVYIGSDGEEVVGRVAKDGAFRNPENTFYDVKRIIGRKITDPELQNDMKFWPFIVKEGEDGIPKVQVNGQLMFPEEISAKLLAKLKTSAEMFLNLSRGSIKKAVITVPAYFNDGQRQATVDAGEIAGLEVLTILNEPTAAAIAYASEETDATPKKILVYDLGGGTFDIAVLDMAPGKINVLGVNGDTHLGGEDFDKKLMEHCASVFLTETGVDLLQGKDSPDPQISAKARRNLRRLQTHCESAKKYLTSGYKAKVTVDALVDGHDLKVDITRNQFEEMNKVTFKKTIDLVNTTLEELGLTSADIDDVVLVGGSTRIPKVQQLLKYNFRGKILNRSVHPDQAVAYGAAIQADIMRKDKHAGQPDAKETPDVPPTPTPKPRQVKDTTPIQIQDVTPMPLGIEIVGNKLSVIIPKNSKIPAKMEDVFVTAFDDQTTANVTIYQGEDLGEVENNKLLGTFQLEGIPPNKAEEEIVDIQMEVDVNGILHVKAVCRSTKGSNSLTVVEHKNRMSKAVKEDIMARACAELEEP